MNPPLPPEMTRQTVAMSAETLRRLKIHAANSGQTQQDIMHAAIVNALSEPESTPAPVAAVEPATPSTTAPKNDLLEFLLSVASELPWSKQQKLDLEAENISLEAKSKAARGGKSIYIKLPQDIQDKLNDLNAQSEAIDYKIEITKDVEELYLYTHPEVRKAAEAKEAKREAARDRRYADRKKAEAEHEKAEAARRQAKEGPIQTVLEEIISAGVKKLALEHHPDRDGGSHEAMQTVNIAAARLREKSKK